ncbi:serine/threonine protein kinase, partial [Linderina macrospora]
MFANQLLASGYMVGRLEECDLVVDRNYISGKHCRLYIEEDPDTNKQSLFIVDMSTNGTYVNDRVLGRNNRTMLFHTDRIGFMQAINADPSDVALEYSIEMTGLRNQTVGQPKFDPKVLDVYDFKNEVGSGNFAKVWMAIHKPSGKTCACKVINKKRHLFSSGLSKVFEREVSILKQLRHAHIVPLDELHIDKDRIYIFMEYLDGGDLYAYLVEHRAFSESACRPIFKQICSAVRYLHSNGVTHRDLKLDNILIKKAPDGTIASVKIADFGLARAVNDGDLMRTICGTPSYLAPEIICRNSASTPYSKSVDIWALGVVLYTLHLNSFPFSNTKLMGETGRSIESYLMASKLKGTNVEYNKLSESLRKLIESMLDVDPELRITIDATIVHPWMQTSENGVPGPVLEPHDVWGRLFPMSSSSSASDNGSKRKMLPIDLFRNRTTVGRSSQCHIQVLDPRVSSQHCEILFRDGK